MAQTFCKQESTDLGGSEFPNRDTGWSQTDPTNDRSVSRNHQVFRSVASVARGA
jgi:hypothetical protein